MKLVHGPYKSCFNWSCSFLHFLPSTIHMRLVNVAATPQLILGADSMVNSVPDTLRQNIIFQIHYTRQYGRGPLSPVQSDTGQLITSV